MSQRSCPRAQLTFIGRSLRRSGQIYGNGAPLDAAQLVARVVSLRRRNAALSLQFRAADKKALEQLEKGLPTHVTAEADRVIGALTNEIRAVGDSVEAARREIMDSQDEIYQEGASSPFGAGRAVSR